MMVETNVLDIAKMVVPAMASLVGLIPGVWWFHRFVRRSDDKTDRLIRDVSDLKTQAEVTHRLRSYDDGKIQQIQESVENANKAIGRNEGSLRKLWGLIEEKYSSKRFSDNGG